MGATPRSASAATAPTDRAATDHDAGAVGPDAGAGDRFRDLVHHEPPVPHDYRAHVTSQPRVAVTNSLS